MIKRIKYKINLEFLKQYQVNVNKLTCDKYSYLEILNKITYWKREKLENKCDTLLFYIKKNNNNLYNEIYKN